MWFPALVLGYELVLLLRRKRHPVALARLWAPALLFAAAIAWVGVQVTTLVPGSVVHPIWGMASEALGAPLPGAISVNPQLSLLALMRLLTDASVFWLSLQLCREPARAFWLVEAVVAIIFAYSLYGLGLFALDRSAIPFFDATAVGPFVRSTFVNRDNFATYAGLGLTGAAALILQFYRHAVPDLDGARSFRLAQLIEATGARGWRLLGAGLVILVALLGTASRGGVLSTALALVAVLGLTFARAERRGARRVEAILFVAVALLAGFFFFGDRIAGRIAEAGLTDTSRAAAYAIILRAIVDAPWFGFGYGVFADVFPMYRDQSISPDGVWDMAHNSYLEVLLGLGLVFGGALIASIGLLAGRAWRGALTRRRNATVPIVAASGALLVGVHALVDFSLEIEAVALTFAALLGAGVAQADSSRHGLSD